jgi:epoxide hydrolase-like predicted phosphatase
MPIKAIIWDMGGVILNMIDESPRLALAQEFNLPLQKIYSAIFDSQSAMQASIGRITLRQHWQNVGNLLDIEPSALGSFLRRFWSADGIDTDLVTFIRTLKLQFRIGLLSNAWDNLRSLIQQEWQIADVFESLVISAEVGLAKPDPRIYQMVLDQLGIQANEAVFLDDLERNIQAARETGLHAIQFRSARQGLMELAALLEHEGQVLNPEAKVQLERITCAGIPTLEESLQMVEKQVDLEYRRTPDGDLDFIPDSSERALFIVYQVNGHYQAYFHHQVPADIRQMLARNGYEKAFSQPEQVEDILAAHVACQRGGPYQTGFFTRCPTIEALPQVVETDGRMEIRMDDTPVSRALSVRENSNCAEVAVETLAAYQRRGFARQVSAAWARQVIQSGRVAFFSFAETNLASRSLAASLGVMPFATSVSFEPKQSC